VFCKVEEKTDIVNLWYVVDIIIYPDGYKVSETMAYNTDMQELKFDNRELALIDDHDEIEELLGIAIEHRNL
jgi:hypothetical protein